MKKSWIMGISIAILILIIAGIYIYNAQKNSAIASSTGSNQATASSSAISSDIESLSEEIASINTNDSENALVPLSEADLAID